MPSYTLNTPAGNQTIASTTIPIQDNFTVTNTAFGVDHTALTVPTNQGKHQKVSLVAQPDDPTPASLTPIIYSENVTYPNGVGIRTELFSVCAAGDNAGAVSCLTNFTTAPVSAITGNSFVPGKPTITGPLYTSGANIIQWGRVTANGSSSGTVTFSPAFPNACFTVLLTNQNNSAVSFSLRVTAQGRTSFNWTLIYTTGVPGNGFVNWWAIGN